jgi:hypothetical protein
MPPENIPPWPPVETESRVDPGEAKKADIWVYGQVCAYLLFDFEHRISVGGYVKGVHIETPEGLSRVKDNLLAFNPGLDAKTVAMLQDFFGKTLVQDPKERAGDIEAVVGTLVQGVKPTMK